VASVRDCALPARLRCVAAHENGVREAGVTVEQIRTAARIASGVHAIDIALKGEETPQAQSPAPAA